MKKKIYAVVGGLLLAVPAAVAQQKVKDGTITSGSIAAAGVILELESNSKGFLMTRMTQTQRDAIANPPEGLLVFNTTDSCINQFNRGQWNSLCETAPFCDVVNVGDSDDLTDTYINPNTAGGIFEPNVPMSTCVLYITEDGGTWTWDGSTYITKPTDVEPWWNKQTKKPADGLSQHIYHFGSANVGTGYSPGTYSFTVGYKDTVSGRGSAAIGTNNNVSNSYSLATGRYNVVFGANALVSGNTNVMSGNNGATIGFSSYNTGSGTLVAGYYDTAIAAHYAQVFGYNNKATGNYAHVSGSNSMAAAGSMAHGLMNQVAGNYSLALGYRDTVSGDYASAIGYNNKVSANMASASGSSNNITSTGQYSTATGLQNTISGTFSLATGDGNIVTGNGDIVGGINVKDSAHYSIVTGDGNVLGAAAHYSMVGGKDNTVTAAYALVNGLSNTVTANYNTVNGFNNAVTGQRSLVIGNGNTLGGIYSSVVGISNNITSGASSAAVFGFNNIDSASYGLVVGQNNIISTGMNNAAVVGFYNQPVDNSLFQVGNGSSSARRNAMTVLSNGHVGIGTTAPVAALEVVSPNYPPIQSVRTSAATNTLLATGRFLHKTTGDMADGFGNRIDFSIADAGGEFQIGHIGVLRNGADNSGDLNFWTVNGGVEDRTMTITKDRNVGIGTTAPTSKLQVVGIPAYDNDAAAGTAGLTTGAFWQTSSTNTMGLPAGVLMVKQ